MGGWVGWVGAAPDPRGGMAWVGSRGWGNISRLVCLHGALVISTLEDASSPKGVEVAVPKHVACGQQDLALLLLTGRQIIVQEDLVRSEALAHAEGCVLVFL